MHSRSCLLAFLLGMAALLLVACGTRPEEAGQERAGAAAQGQGAGRWIVVFDKQFANEPAQAALLEAFGGQPLKHLRLVNGAVVLLPPTARAQLAARPEVRSVEPDATVCALKGKPPHAGGKPKPSQPAQTLPWGVDRIDAEFAWSAGYTGAGVDVAVVDTGIDKDHPDLAANIAGGVNFVAKSPRKPPDADKWDDDNGHGTYVAGIIAAQNNDIGVVGVAPEARLWAVKVLDRSGSGYVSDVIDALGWCADTGVEIANMSLGTDSDVEALCEACAAARAAGVLLVAAAGNDGAEVDYPAAYDSVIAVAATDMGDARPSWSSFGPEVFLAAPGADIRSTWRRGGYATESGTSAATPHVAGTLALNLAADLAATADDVPPSGRDAYTGWGVVDAEEAATGQQTGDDLGQ